MSSFYWQKYFHPRLYNFFYKQLKSVHKVRKNYGKILFGSPVKLVKCHLRILVLTPRNSALETKILNSGNSKTIVTFER